MTEVIPRKALLDTSTQESAGRWDDLLTLQVDLFLDHEANHLGSLAAWRSARSVVDVGCGNGYYLSRLSERHPDKTYVGIDVSAELIERARRFRRTGLAFTERDFLKDGAPRSDLILLRFVLQHLPDLGAVLTQAGQSLSADGKLVVIDPDFAESRCEPPLPLFMGMFAAFERWRAALGLLRGGSIGLGERIKAFPDWRVASDAIVSVVQTAPFGRLTPATFSAWIDLCERAGDFTYPFAATRAEVARWVERDEATSNIALRITVLERARPN